MTNQQQQLLDAYPNARQAVAWTELILCVPPPGETDTSWDIMMNAKMPLAEILDAIKHCIQEEINDGAPGKRREALAQCNHPQFLTYLKGKMGAM